MAHRSPRAVIAALVLLTVSACAEPPAGQLVSDPYKPVNQTVHAFNKGLDRVVLRPTSQVYGVVVGREGNKLVQSAAETISLPNRIVNKVLQFRLVSAVEDTFRLGVNLTFGLLGLRDVATEMGIPNDDTDFGETLHVWGANEGNYVELPFFGSSTERDAVGLIVDTLLLDPLNGASSGSQSDALVLQLTSIVGNRNEFADLIDSILYESADSYTAQQSAYIQNRRFQLRQNSPDDALLDDPYALDLLEDPYAE
ncbi:MAG: VacJ family lipoprotein [Pseudomonadota bacterium]